MTDKIVLTLLKQYDFLYEEYIIKNKSRKELSEELQISENTLKYYLKKHKLIKNNDQINKNRIKTNLQKYGQASFFSSAEFQEKAIQTWLKKYNVTNPSKSPHIHKKQQNSLQQHFKDDPTLKEKIHQKKINTNLQKYGKEFFVLTDQYKAYYKNKQWLKEKQQKELNTKKLHNKADQQKLAVWKEKANTKPQYKRAIQIWTKSDPLKRKIAKRNNLNWLEFFTVLDIINWLNNYKLQENI